MLGGHLWQQAIGTCLITHEAFGSIFNLKPPFQPGL